MLADLRHNQEHVSSAKSAICDNEPDTGMEYMDTGMKFPACYNLIL